MQLGRAASPPTTMYNIYRVVFDAPWGRPCEAEASHTNEPRDGGRGSGAEESTITSADNGSSKLAWLDGSKCEEEAKPKKEARRKKKRVDKGLTRNLADGDEGPEEEQNAQEAWDTLVRSDLNQSSDDWDELTAEQKCFPSFEAWASFNERVCPSLPSMISSRLKPYDSADYRSQLEETMCLVQGPGFNYSLLGRVVTRRLFVEMDLNSILASSRTCRRWNEASKDASLWREKFRRLEQEIYGEEPDVNIWEELGIDFERVPQGVLRGELKRASLNALVAAVTSHTEVPDSIDVSTFMMSYQTFTTIRQVIRKLIQRYLVPEKKQGSEEEKERYKLQVVRPIQMRVCKLLKQIVEMRYEELDGDLLLLIKYFIMGSIDQSFLAKQLQMTIKAAANRSDWAGEAVRLVNKPSVPKKSLMANIFDVPSEEIARQLTLIEFQLYSRIKPTELFDQSWAKPKLHCHAPNIRAMIERFNQITRWITTEIVSEEKIRNRVKRFTKFIKVAQALRTMNNYHTLMAVLGGLNEGPIYRLKHTRSEIPLKAQQTLSELQLLMSADGSYCEYRLALTNSLPPCIPYIGVYLRDLTYYEEGSGSSEAGLINFKSKKNVYTIIQIIQKYQVVPYCFKKQERVFHYLNTISGLPDSTLFELSALREPKNAKRTDFQ